MGLGYVIFVLGLIFVVCPVSVYLMGRRAERKKLNENKKSDILFNATTIGRNVTPEEVFNTLDEAGIAIGFLQNESN